MGDLSKNFSRSEFACKCGCGFDAVNPRLVKLLQWIRDDLGYALTVHSGCRCDAHNAKVGGAKNSQHLLGNAADITVLGTYPEKLYEYLEQTCGARIGGMGLYKTFVHVDVREGRARWRG